MQIDTEIGKIGDFQIEATQIEIEENIPDIPAKLLPKMSCPDHKFSMTCDFYWEKVSMISSSYYYPSTFPFRFDEYHCRQVLLFRLLLD